MNATYPLQSSQGVTVHLDPHNMRAKVQTGHSSTVQFEKPQIQYEILGTLSHDSLLQKIDQIREDLFAVPYPKENPSALWIFSATKETLHEIVAAKEHLHQLSNSGEQLKLYEKILHCFKNAHKLSENQPRLQDKLKDTINQTRKEYLLKKWTDTAPSFLVENETAEFVETIERYADSDDFLELLHMYATLEKNSLGDWLLSAFLHEENNQYELAALDYLKLSEKSIHKYACLAKAYSLMTTQSNQRSDILQTAIEKIYLKGHVSLLLQNSPRCFICLNVEEAGVKEWIKVNLAPDLERLGIQTILCSWNLTCGMEIKEFQEQARFADLAIIACTPDLKRKSEDRKTGVAQQLMLLKNRYFDDKYYGTTFPIYLKGSRREDFPGVYFEGVFGPKFQLQSSSREHSKFNYYYQVIELFAAMKGIEQSRRKAAEIQKTFLEETKILILQKLQSQPHNKPTREHLPKPPKHFVGRESDLTFINETFQETNRIAIAGLGGMGKTTLSLKYAKETKCPFAWMHQVRAETISEDLLKLAECLGLAGTNDDQKLQKLKEKLQQQIDYLLIVDGIDDEEKHKEIESYCENNTGKILLTTRNKNTAENYGYETRELRPLEADKSATYLLKEARRENRQAAIELANILGNHPLALTHAARYIRGSGIAIREYQTLFRTNPEIHQDVELKENEKTIITTWEVSLDRIINHHKCPEAELLLNFLSHLADSQISLKLLDTWRIINTHPTIIKPQFLKTINQLVNYSLITISAPGQYEVHPLVKYVTRHKQENQGSKKLKTLNLLNKHIKNYNMQDRSEREEGIELAPHVEYLLAYAWQAEIISSHSPFINLSFKPFECYHHNGNYTKALALETKNLKRLKKIHGEKHPDVARSLNNVGNTLGALGRPEEALVRQSEALALRKELLGEKHPDVATSLNNVGITLGALGRHEEALERKSEALALFKELLGEKHPDVASSLDNMGSTLGDLGRHEEALVRQSEALALFKELLGEKHPDVATSLNNVGCTMYSLERFAEALDYFTKALEVTRESLGERHPLYGVRQRNKEKAEDAVGRERETAFKRQKPESKKCAIS